jgi:hypothetical protein
MPVTMSGAFAAAIRRGIDRDPGFQLRCFGFKRQPAFGNLVVQVLEFDVQRSKKVANLEDLLSYLFKFGFQNQQWPKLIFFPRRSSRPVPANNVLIKENSVKYLSSLTLIFIHF